MNAASAPAIAHASVDIRRAETPARSAASELAAAARIRSPVVVRARNHASPATITGPNRKIAMWAR